VKLGHVATLLGVGLVVICGCGKTGDSSQKKSGAPAQVGQPGDEQSLNTITLTETAEQRLAIPAGIAQARLADVRRKRKVGGEVVVPPGQTIVVSAPIAGTLCAPQPGPVPSPGSRLAAGEAVFGFTPLLTPERDVLTPAERVRVAQSKADLATAAIEAQRQVESAKLNVEATRLAYDRTVQLLRDKAGSQRSVDEAEAQWKLALQALATAEARSKFLSGIQLDEEAGELTCRSIESPVAGVLQSIDAVAGETVAAGERLFQVMMLDHIWIRVPIYVGQWREVDTEQGASIAEYGQPPDAPTRTAKYVSAPPSADPAATTVDLFYELANEDGRLYPGQKLEVTLPMRSRRQSLVVPWSAILYDFHGGAWIYEQVAPQTYVRRRVAVKHVDAQDLDRKLAILAAEEPYRQLAPGAKVVTDGAVELFGTEFGVGK